MVGRRCSAGLGGPGPACPPGDHCEAARGVGGAFLAGTPVPPLGLLRGAAARGQPRTAHLAAALPRGAVVPPPADRRFRPGVAGDRLGGAHAKRRFRQLSPARGRRFPPSRAGLGFPEGRAGGGPAGEGPGRKSSVPSRGRPEAPAASPERRSGQRAAGAE